MADRSHGLVVVGSGPGGLAAARSFRELVPDGPVRMITADSSPPYARPPLTKDFLQGDSELEDLWLTETGWLDEQGIELTRDTRVVELDPRRQRLVLADGSTVDFDDVVLATGSHPVPLALPGGDDPELVYVRDLTSGHRLRDLALGTGRVAVVGSGFIGCEAAASLAARGREVVLITGSQLPHAARLGDEAGRQILGWLREAGVDTRLGSAVATITRTADGFELRLADGAVVSAASVVVGGGAQPDLTLAEGAGLVTDSGGVRVDPSMRTSAPHVFAVGDLAYARHTAAGRHLRVEHWGDAETQGEIAGVVAAGGTRSWDDPPGFWSTIGDRTLKYSAWGDGHDEAVFTGTPDRWSVWFRSGAELCGVLTHGDDDSYERGQQLLRRRAGFAEALAYASSSGRAASPASGS